MKIRPDALAAIEGSETGNAAPLDAYKVYTTDLSAHGDHGSGAVPAGIPDDSSAAPLPADVFYKGGR